MSTEDILGLGQMERIEQFYRQMKYTDLFVVKKIFEDALNIEKLDRNFCFFVGIEKDGVFFLLDDGEKDKQWIAADSLSGREENIKAYLCKKTCIAEGSIRFCRNIARWDEEDREVNLWYFMAFEEDGIDVLYLQEIENAFYQWLSLIIAKVLNSVNQRIDLSVFITESNLNELYRSIVLNFEKTLLNILKIDTRVITELSGSYYEGSPCNSSLVFWLEKDMPKDGFSIEEPITVETQHIRQIRKLMEMGKSGQHLLVKRICGENDTWGKWKVDGLYQIDLSRVNAINFQILQHMVWNMNIKGNNVICFKNGKYMLNNREKYEEKFVQIYEKLFAKKAGKKIRSIYREAISQEHGTVIVIIERGKDNKIFKCKDEVERLVEESAGIKIKENQLLSGFVKSVTSIDGAAIFDEFGSCYGIGMILDHMVKMKGRPDRGARFNSTQKYIATCHDKGIKAMAVIVSEDKTIETISTQDKMNYISKRGKKDE